jgi:hypothetical protein
LGPIPNPQSPIPIKVFLLQHKIKTHIVITLNKIIRFYIPKQFVKEHKLLIFLLKLYLFKMDINQLSQALILSNSNSQVEREQGLKLFQLVILT